MATADTGGWTGQSLAGGRFRVQALLGEGGMAFVYRARDEQNRRDVVIKMPRQAMLHDAEFSARFVREIRSLQRLTHANVVAVVDAGSHDGIPFVVLEYLPGGSLRDRQRGGPQSAATLVGWLEGVAGALDYLHGQKLVHRDVKPDNILFDAQGRVKLGDFGVVKVLSQGEAQRAQTVMTAAGMVLGTPQYMAPELILAKAYDGRLDQYALAVTVFEYVTGKPPFDGASATAIFLKQVSDAPPSARGLCAAVPEALARVLQRGMAKEAPARYPTCAAFARAALDAAGVPAGTRSPLLVCPHCQKGVVPKVARGQRVCPECERPLAMAPEPILLEEQPILLTDPDTVTAGPGTEKQGRKSRRSARQGPARDRTMLILGLVFGGLALFGLLALVFALMLAIFFW
jgi:serine/threonine-protein kinase